LNFDNAGRFLCETEILWAVCLRANFTVVVVVVICYHLCTGCLQLYT
jgi:hypothetical protein